MKPWKVLVLILWILIKKGNVEIVLSEDNEFILQSFTLRASRERYGKLKDIAASNVGQYLVLESDLDHLSLPQTLQILVKKFTNTYTIL